MNAQSLKRIRHIISPVVVSFNVSRICDRRFYLGLHLIKLPLQYNAHPAIVIST